MYKISLVLCSLFSFNAFANETVDIQEVNRKYEKIIHELSENCKHLDKKAIPETTEEKFCSNSPYNNLTVRYCIYQNLINSENNVTLNLQFPTEVYPDGSTSEIEFIYKCSDLKI